MEQRSFGPEHGLGDVVGDGRCKARSRQSGEQCKNRVKLGALVCHIHGGKTPATARKAAERAVEIKARRTLAQVGGDFDPLGNPLEALEGMASRMIAFTEVMGDLVSRLESVRYAGSTGEQLRAEVAVYTGSMVATVNALEKIGRLDIDGRLARIQGAQAERVVAVVMAGIDTVCEILSAALVAAGADPGVVADARAAGRAAAGKALRSVSGD
jgi:hypothetical protein